VVTARQRLGLTWLIVASVIALLPLAHASPPDPTWVPGVWDDEDQDEVAILATSASGIADAHDLSGAIPLRILLGRVGKIAHGVLAGRSLPGACPRAPPSA
jgi:hypothetical protein